MHPHVQVLLGLWKCLQDHLYLCCYGASLLLTSVTIEPHCQWLYIVILAAHNNFMKIKVIELVICLWGEMTPLPPLALKLSTFTDPICHQV